MTRYFYAIIISMFLIISITQISLAAGLYSKPEFRGRIIDAETKQPLEGVVVVVLYYKQSTVSINPGGANAYVFNAKETLTDKNGEFFLPSYSTLMLISKGMPIRFIFYKSEYMAIEGASFKNAGISDVGISFEKYFSTGPVGQVAEIEEGKFEDSSYVKWKGIAGIVELKRAKTWEDRRKTRPSSGGLKSEQLPIFFKTLDEEYKYIYKE